MHPLETIKRNNWPPIIDDIAEIIGDDAALKMFIRFSGRHLFIPIRGLHNNNIEQTIGSEKSKLLSKEFGSETITFPNGKLLLLSIRFC